MADAGKEEEEESMNKKQGFDGHHVSIENPPLNSVMELEILPRLPLKSLLRLELASKPLSPLISDHLRRRYSLPNAVAGLFFRWPISVPPLKKLYHALDSTVITSLPPDKEMCVIDSCGGLLLCQLLKPNKDDNFFICNPLTGQWASVPETGDDNLDDPVYISHDAVLAFDPRVSGHYDILNFGSGVVDVFSSETGNWVQRRSASHKPKVDDIYPFFFDGKVYLSSWRFPFVKLFNRQGELVGRINLPNPALGDQKRLLGHSGGRLHYAAKMDDKMLVWILDDPDESRWVLKHSVSLQHIYVTAGRPRWGHYLLRFHPDMDVIFIKANDMIFSYNMDNGKITEVYTFTSYLPLVPRECRFSQSVFAYSPCYSKHFDL